MTSLVRSPSLTRKKHQNNKKIVSKSSDTTVKSLLLINRPRFNMQSAKFASTPLPIHLRLSQRDRPTSGSEGENMKSVPYAPAVGSLMYAMVATRPDISHVVGVISRFMHNPGRSHWNAVKHVFRYLAGTKDHGILFGPNSMSGTLLRQRRN